MKSATRTSKIEIIRANGDREHYALPFSGRRLLRWVYEKIGAVVADTVNLRDGRVLICDDNGWECETIDHGEGRFELKPIRALKPINREATSIYHKIHRTTHQIVGDVAIANDEDFA